MCSRSIPLTTTSSRLTSCRSRRTHESVGRPLESFAAVLAIMFPCGHDEVSLVFEQSRDVMVGRQQSSRGPAALTCRLYRSMCLRSRTCDRLDFICRLMLQSHAGTNTSTDSELPEGKDF